MTIVRILALPIAVLSLAARAAAQEAPPLLFPVDCTLGQTCFLQQFVDHDPGPGARAFDCGPQSYDGHTGTDIRLADFAALAQNIAVRAAAPGIVRALRDDVPDAGSAAAPEGQECGNGLAITHEGGWETQYCHLMEDSLSVAEGDRVERGTPLGRVGYSGNTAFPHLEFILRHDGEVVDPFAPDTDARCGNTQAALWDVPIANPGGGILSAGFAPAVPDYDAVRDGEAHAGRMQAATDALVLWGYVHGGRAGDVLRLTITDADGSEVLAQDVALDRTQAQLFRAAGRRVPDGGWTPGLYRGEVILLRNDGEIDRATTVTILDTD